MREQVERPETADRIVGLERDAVFGQRREHARQSDDAVLAYRARPRDADAAYFRPGYAAALQLLAPERNQATTELVHFDASGRGQRRCSGVIEQRRVAHDAELDQRAADIEPDV